MLSSINFELYDKMSIVVDTDFADWLLNELKERGWSQADLSREAGINRQVISTYINRQRQKPEPEVLLAIANAFHLPPEVVFRAAGLLPPAREPDPLDSEAAHLVSLLPEDKKQIAVEYIRFLVEMEEKKGRGRRT